MARLKKIVEWYEEQGDIEDELEDEDLVDICRAIVRMEGSVDMINLSSEDGTDLGSVLDDVDDDDFFGDVAELEEGEESEEETSDETSSA